MNKFLTSSGGVPCVVHLKELELGSSHCHISLWDIEYGSRMVTRAVHNFSRLGQSIKLRFNTNDQIKQSFEILKDCEMVVVHGGNTETIMTSIKRLGLGPELKRISEIGTYVGISAGTDVAFNLGIIPRNNVMLKVHWDIYYKNPQQYNTDVHGQGQPGIELSTDEAIRSHEGDVFLLYDDSYLEWNRLVSPYGKMIHRHKGEWYEYHDASFFAVDSPLKLK